MQPMITENRDKIIELCRRHHVRRLSVFGSAVRDDFDPERSDMDFVVEFDPVKDRPAYEIQSILKDELVKLFSRPVDLIRAGTVRNPYIRQSIEEQQETLYAA
jgi:predicted nucleotidyltransferase